MSNKGNHNAGDPDMNSPFRWINADQLRRDRIDGLRSRARSPALWIVAGLILAALIAVDPMALAVMP